jgi:hypothetical protein
MLDVSSLPIVIFARQISAVAKFISAQTHCCGATSQGWHAGLGDHSLLEKTRSGPNHFAFRGFSLDGEAA